MSAARLDPSAVRRFLRARRHGALATLSLGFAGWPFASLVPYLLGHDGQALVLLSRLAEHTRNLEADSRASLLVAEGGPDAQAGMRVTMLGHARPCPDPERPRARYLRYFPEAERLLALGDFAFYALAPRALRVIAGFGEVGWLEPERYAPPPSTLEQEEERLLAEWNARHAGELRALCQRHHGRSPEPALLIGVDCDGFDVRAGAEVLRFHFAQEATDGAAARERLLAMAALARSP
jgi:putative heme iron utilization protein